MSLPEPIQQPFRCDQIELRVHGKILISDMTDVRRVPEAVCLAGSITIIFSMATISEVLAVAVQHHQAGRLQVAEQIYRQVLAVEPTQPEAWHLLGVASAQLGEKETGIDCLRRALAIKPDWPEMLFNLGRESPGSQKAG